MARYRYSDRDYDAYPPYVPVAEKQSRNRRAVAKLRRGNAQIQPVVVEGRTIARSWWGKSWNSNLERYADYGNRIGRGRSYVCHGAVLDLGIEAGVVNALVQGSRGSPYEVTVTIGKLDEGNWVRLREVAVERLDSLTDLLAGEFPKALRDAFFAQGTGLFPTPGEISFACSCPDWASMCKHVAAVLYGVGNRLDAAPELLFTLRQVTVEDLIARTVDATAEHLISKAKQAAGDDVLDAVDLEGMFGIELDAAGAADVGPPARRTEPRAAPRSVEAEAPRAARRKTDRGKKPAQRASRARTTSGGDGRSAAAGTRGRRPVAPAESATPRRGSSSARLAPEHGRMVAQLVSAFGRSRKTYRTAELLEKLPSWTRLQVTNTLQRALSEGLLKRVERGVYRRT